MSKYTPLIIDLDNTLIRTDILYESVLLLIRQNFLYLFCLPYWLFQGKTTLKKILAEKVEIPVRFLPYNQKLIEYIKQEKDKGRRIVLATATHISVAEKVASHLNIFDNVIGTDGSTNNKGIKKLHAIKALVGEDFAYAGDSIADVPIWNEASAAVLVNVTQSVSVKIKAEIPREFIIKDTRGGFSEWVKAIRVHQWVKNGLVFVPMITTFSFDAESLFVFIIAALAFSIVASSTYIINDLLDIYNDRAHPRKCHRPLASASISIPNAILASVILLAIGLTLAACINLLFLITVLIYLAMTLGYSLILKNYVLLDTIVLSLLYTIRIIAGSAVAEVTISEWLLAFSVFIFLSLALVKRCSELVMLQVAGKKYATGRNYYVSDLQILWPLGVGAAVASVVVYCQFISSASAIETYESPWFLWLAAPGLIYWLSRLWIKTSRGEMHDDPIVYALKNRGSLLTIALVLTIILLGRFAVFF